MTPFRSLTVGCLRCKLMNKQPIHRRNEASHHVARRGRHSVDTGSMGGGKKEVRIRIQEIVRIIILIQLGDDEDIDY